LLSLATDLLCVFDATSSKRGDLDELRERVRGAAAGMAFILNKVLHADDYLFAEASREVPTRSEPIDSEQDPAEELNVRHAVDL
jgi:hypothetical protein